ncbi:hypothetical protein ORV05_00910 [Amycolatopsis cynarae]|uniref:Uncharacterized protein n=1 Tax=Amycolatopsis cynarae TaxID=2995223 RepID=A0ABY7B6L3_9PSEU|nr:hypothetical protein [Amycolatopsis sp. HUAS 11-8]WAL66413.1 hypothetical protein ORV05_00910 [Amycolatopsis sp. HUAS 11-8]
MNEKAHGKPEAAAGVPQPNPPKGGPNQDEETPNPADLAPGFGGTTETRPVSTEEERPDDVQERK